MSRIKKYGSIVTLIIILLIIVTSTVYAKAISIDSITATGKVGDTVMIGIDDLFDNKFLYCIQHGKSLRTTPSQFEIKEYFEINGNTVKDKNGKESVNELNGQIAYILSQGEGYGNKAGTTAAIDKNGNKYNRYNVEYTNTQKALYLKFNEWVKSINKSSYSYGGNIKNIKQPTNNILNEAKKYAESINNISIDNSDKTVKSDITYNLYQDSNGTLYYRIGPFKWNYSGEIEEVKVWNQKDKWITGTEISTLEGNVEKFGIEYMKSGKEFYINIKINSDGSYDATKITKITAKLKGTEEIKTAKIWFLTTGKKQNLLAVSTGTKDNTIQEELSYNYNILLRGNLKVIKVDKDNNVMKLKDVEFKIKNNKTSLYVNKDSIGKITYVSEDEATIFKTDSNGEIFIENLLPGRYTAYEIKNPNYGYELPTGGFAKNIVIDKTAELKIENKLKYIKIGGYVWQDNPNQKNQTEGARDNLFYRYGQQYTINNETLISNDQLIKGITVYLKDNNGNVVKTAVTDLSGRYEFTDVLIQDLENYYVEFVYDGFTYSPVTTTNELRVLDNSSKASEVSEERTTLNNKFATVTGTSNLDIDKGQANSEQGKEVDLSYNRQKIEPNNDKSKYLARYNKNIWTYEDKGELIVATKNQDIYNVSSNTSLTKYSLKDLYNSAMKDNNLDKLKNINLGLKTREQSNAIIYNNDIEAVKLTINGYTNVYKYGQKSLTERPENGLNVATNISSYKRYIYTSDIKYNETHKDDNRLRVYVTYKIILKNTSNTLYMDINELVDYYDAKYKTDNILIGTEFNSSAENYGIINSNKLKASELSKTNQNKYSNNEYKAIYISKEDGSAIARLAPNESKDIYIQYELSDNEVLEILNGERTVNNVAEIYSYTTYEKMADNTYNLYAAVDYDSAVGNAKPGMTETYENDTDVAPTLALKSEGERSLGGKVFEDTTSGELKTEEIREGDGEYKDGEPGIAGVTVTMTENNKENPLVYSADAVTDENGDYIIRGFVPGDYTITYEWGNEKYTVQDYKGTIYKDMERKTNKEWYKAENPRYSDAIDNYDIRKNIDAEITTIKNSTEILIDKMKSVTPILGIGIEYNSTETASQGNKYEYRINNIDLGIVERARQSVVIQKHVSYIKLTLANGQVLVEGDPRKDNLDYVSYLPPTDTDNGTVQITLDSELIHGSVLEIKYEFTLTNNSELDYNDQKYYLYGSSYYSDLDIIKDKKVKITSSSIVDYVDNELELPKDVNNVDLITIEDLVNNKYIPDNEEIRGLINKHTTIASIKEVFDNFVLTPGEEKIATNIISMSKLLSNDEELAYDNSGEVIQIMKTGGSTLRVNLGEYKIGGGIGAEAETVIVMPPYGQARIYYIIGALSLIILTTGIIVIKKKVLDK